MQRQLKVNVFKVTRFVRNNLIIIALLCIIVISIFIGSYNFLIFSIIFISLVGILYRILRLMQEKRKGVPGAGINLKVTLIFVVISVVPSSILTFTFETFTDQLIPSELAQELVELRDIGVNEKLYNSNKLKLIVQENNDLFDTISNDVLNDKILKELDKINFITDFYVIFNVSGDDLKILLKKERNIPDFRQGFTENELKGFYYKINKGFNFIAENKMEEPRLDRNHYIWYYISKRANSNDYIMTGNFISDIDMQIADKIVQMTKLMEKSKQLTKHSMERLIFIISLPLIIIALILGLYLSRGITKPIEALLRGTRQIAKGILNHRIKTDRSDELGTLIHSFNFMAEELQENKNELYKVERLAAWREVAKRLAHEFKNPLTPIKLASERILRQYDRKDPNFEEILNSSIKTIISEVERLKKLVNDFSDFSKLPKASYEETNIINLINEVKDLYLMTSNSVDFDLKSFLNSKDEIIAVDPKQLKQVVMNLVQNSIDSISQKFESNFGGKIFIIIQKIIKPHTHLCRIAISDNGIGIEEEAIPQLFEPYFSTKKMGTGLGLAIVKSIVEEHKGKIYVESKEGKGVTFFIEIPYYLNKETIL